MLTKPNRIIYSPDGIIIDCLRDDPGGLSFPAPGMLGAEFDDSAQLDVFITEQKLVRPLQIS